jgi:hypothetical protein
VNSGVGRDWCGWMSGILFALGSHRFFLQMLVSMNGRWPSSFSIVNCILLWSPLKWFRILSVFLGHGAR